MELDGGVSDGGMEKEVLYGGVVFWLLLFNFVFLILCVFIFWRGEF